MGTLSRLSRLLSRGDGGDDGEPYAYPLDRTQDRSFDDTFEGDVFFWDIDKTYLASEFDSLKGLLSVPLEFAIDKRNVAGTDVLLRALRRGTGDDTRYRSNPLYFVSASPPQLRGVLERKMQLDGVEFDGITFKDQLGLLKAGRVAAIKHHVGYKLTALLLNRVELPWGVRETTFGDDSESDALIYGLYADVVAGRLRGESLRRTLQRQHVDPEDVAFIVDLTTGLPEADLVDRIYINLENRTSPAAFLPWGRRVVPCYDVFQMAVHLHHEGKVAQGAVLEVGRDLLNHYEREPLGLLRSALDLLERGLLGVAWLAELWPALQAEQLVPRYATIDPSRATDLAVDAAPRLPGEFVTPIEKLSLAPA